VIDFEKPVEFGNLKIKQMIVLPEIVYGISEDNKVWLLDERIAVAVVGHRKEYGEEKKESSTPLHPLSNSNNR
jgi:hypothetical protein